MAHRQKQNLLTILWFNFPGGVAILERYVLLSQRSTISKR